MTNWHKEIETALLDFVTVAKLANEILQLPELEAEFLENPHEQPKRLPPGKMAIYGFWWEGQWLKIGIAGPNTKARYTSQHYNPNSAPSTLASSLLKDYRMQTVPGFTPEDPGGWLKAKTCRVNLLISAEKGTCLLKLLEAFLHARLKPRYEGR